VAFVDELTPSDALLLVVRSGRLRQRGAGDSRDGGVRPVMPADGWLTVTRAACADVPGEAVEDSA
jgi:hypothetical protein